MKSVTETVKKVNGHYSIGMPLRNKNVVMSKNKSVAEQRASNLKRKTKDLIALCESGGFRLTKWSSNIRKVLSSLPEQERAKEIKNLKPVTIPRLELNTATIAVKMDNLMKGELRMDLKESVLWTDSTTVLQYIDNDGARFKTFVANTVTQREHTFRSAKIQRFCWQ